WNRNSVHLAFDRLRVILGLRKLKELGITVEGPPRFRKAAVKPEELAAARREQEAKLRGRRNALYKLARTHAKRHCRYHAPLSWATRALRRGIDPLTVAILLGHSDPSMLAKVYQHLAHDPAFLQQAARRASADDAAPRAAE